MTTGDLEAGTYQSTPLPVLPGVVVRGVVLGVVYAAFVVVFAVATAVGRGDAGLDVDELLGVATATRVLALGALALFFPFAAVVALATVDYRRRRYVFEDDRLTEVRGVFSTRTESIPYDDVEDVTLTRSVLQRLYGVGTVRINEVDLHDGGTTEVFLVRHVREPGTFYSELRSAVVDPGGSRADLPPVESVAGHLSSLSPDQLAADTSSDYLMPRAVLHPQPRYPALFGALVVLGAVLSFAPVLFVSLFVFDALGAGIGASVPWTSVAGMAALGVGAVVALAAGGSYRRYDRIHYELYDDHVRKVTPGEQTAVQFADVGGVTRPGTGRGAVRRLWDTGTTGHVGLRAAEGNQLLVLEYVEHPDDVQELLETLVEAARSR